MRRLLVFIFSVILVTGLSSVASGQCKSFARRICKLDLGNYVHDGNFHAAILKAGEEAELYKTFYSDINYRIAICRSEVLDSRVEFKVLDTQRNVIYDNSNDNYKNVWDFRPEASQQLMIWLRVPPAGPGRDTASGCVAILFGFSDRRGR